MLISALKLHCIALDFRRWCYSSFLLVRVGGRSRFGLRGRGLRLSTCGGTRKLSPGFTSSFLCENKTRRGTFSSIQEDWTDRPAKNTDLFNILFTQHCVREKEREKREMEGKKEGVNVFGRDKKTDLDKCGTTRKQFSCPIKREREEEMEGERERLVQDLL